MYKRQVVILSGSRTAIGSFGGSLKSVSPIELGTVVAKKALEISEVDKNEVGQVAFGHVINTEPKDMYLSRVVALNSGLPKSVAAMNVNRLCGSGLQAIVSVIQSLTLGDSNFGLAGGSENMSNSPHILKSNRWGKRMGNTTVEDMMLGALNCPFGTGHMGVTAENVASEYGISREDQDKFALGSQTKAGKAIESGRMAKELLTVEIPGRRGDVTIVNKDEHPRPDTTLEALSKLPTPFRKEGGSVTPGYASGVYDGAAAMIIASEDAAKQNGLTIRARVVACATAGVEPRIMGIGPAPASQKVLDRAGLKISDMDVIELNEAFASQALATMRELGIEDDDPRVNPNGGAIALGHPLGASGARLILTAAQELEETGGRYGLCTMCIGVGQGMATIIERV